MKSNARFVIAPQYAQSDDLTKHYQYMCFLFQTHDLLDEEEKQEVAYRNYLQSPLQPLADNLESATYEVFENDGIKYDLYEQACYHAIMDKL